MTTRRKLIGYALALPVLGALTRPAQATTAPVFHTKLFALQGFDPVGYFEKGRPVAGKEDFMVKWMGAVWRFASADHMMAFEANPHRFAPQYGGYCAYHVSQGVITKSVPEAWTIHQNKLYLNYSLAIRRQWRKNMNSFIASADALWPEILQR